MNRTSLKTQLTFLIVISFTVVIISLIFYMYKSNSKTIVEQETSRLSTLLKLESANLDAYLSEIERYSLLMRNNAEFMFIISSKSVMSYEELALVRNLLKNTFDSRNDLSTYRLFLINKSINYTVDSTKRTVQSFYNTAAQDLPNYSEIIKGKYYRVIEPTTEANQFIRFYRAIINIEDQKPLAVVELTFDTSFIQSLSKSYQEKGEQLMILDQNNQPIYTNFPNRLQTNELNPILNSVEKSPQGHITQKIGDQDFLIVFNKSALGLYKILTLKPISEIEEKIIHTRNVSLILGMLALSITMILSITFITLVTKPLTTLAYRMQQAGRGNFTTTIQVEGSSEIANLADNYNLMIRQIDELIKKTYLSELSEKTARLIALEAQLNPHFLYNTLQAISAEAVVNQQHQINYMITALAAMLRYTIKGDEMVTLEEEIKHVKDYLLLQQSRFEDNLSYEMNIGVGCNPLFIPKICIQTLVENAIIHGMKGEVSKIHLNISSYIDEDFLIINICDNGNGIEADKLLLLHADLLNISDYLQSSNNIGLMNLRDRLRLIYVNRARIDIDSIPCQSTNITLTIPVEKEFRNV